MTDYQVDYCWDHSGPLAVLHVTLTGSLLSDPGAIPAIIDQAHALVDQSDALTACIAYDLTGMEGHLPLEALMRRGAPSPRVARVAIIGARTRPDEMAVLIMSAAKRVPYPVHFFATLADAAPFLTESQPAPNAS